MIANNKIRIKPIYKTLITYYGNKQKSINKKIFKKDANEILYLNGMQSMSSFEITDILGKCENKNSHMDRGCHITLKII